MALSERGLKVTEYPLATSVYQWNWPRGSKNRGKGQLTRNKKGEIKGMDPFDGLGNFYGHDDINDNYAAYGGSLDGMYELFGIMAFANEIYRFGDDLNEDGRVSQSEQLIYNDKTMKGRVFKEWKSFDHPTLGKVEIGGWKKFGQNNPLPEFLPREVDRNVDFMLMQARAMPLLEISDVEQTYLNNDNYRLTVTISNTGFQPTELAIRKNNNRAVPVRVNLSTANNVTILDEKQEKDAGHISGNGEAEVTWLIQGPRGGSVTINAYHPKGGRTVQTLKLKR
tara:strand:- start:296 stop:1138 length:843 start_codon:yes stop_codon:yes gene_type:complete